MGSLLGGSKQKSTSSNQAYNGLNTALSPVVNTTGNATNALQALLGLGGDPGAASQAYNNYRNSTGYDFQMDQGQRAITGSAAAKGLLDSGSTAKALTSFGQGLASQNFNGYLDRLLGLGDMGLKAGGVLANAGQQSQSSGKTKKGIGGLIGSAGAAIAASDRRLKKNIFKVGELPNGLNIYQYRYTNNDGPYIGVMADEVKALQPEALGPSVGGYLTVDYSKIKGL